MPRYTMKNKEEKISWLLDNRHLWEAVLFHKPENKSFNEEVRWSWKRFYEASKLVQRPMREAGLFRYDTLGGKGRSRMLAEGALKYAYREVCRLRRRNSMAQQNRPPLDDRERKRLRLVMPPYLYEGCG